VAGAVLLPGRARAPALVVAGLLAAVALVNGPSDRLARMEYARGQYEPKIEFSGWNALSRVVVYPLSRTEAEQTWGLSRRYGGEAPAMKGMLVDDAGYTPIMAAPTEAGGSDGSGAPPPSAWASHHVVSLPFLLRPGGSAFIIGPGGGRDLLCAVGAGASRVTAVELNPLEVRAVQDVFGAFSGRPYTLPQVETIVGEGRSVAARRAERYDVLQASSVFGEVSPAAGAFSLSANFLYTREAFALYWERLADDGVLSFSWSLYGRRVHRLTALARDLVLSRGGDPAASIAILRERGLATLLVRKGGFTPGEVACLEGIAAQEGFAVEALPGRPAATALARVISGEDTGGGRFDLSPPTDDRPFFYNDVPRSRFFSLLLTPGEPGERHIVVLRSMGAVLALLTLLLLLLPWFSRRSGERPPRALLARSSLFFLGIGLGYLLIELTVMQALVLFLGEPVLALSAVLASLLVFSGLGSWWAGREGGPVARWAARIPILLPGAAILLNLGVWEAATRLSPGLPLPLAGKAALVFALLAPGGFVMGCFMPMGLAAVGARFPRLVPWAWAVNGAASVMGSLLSLVVAMNFGYSRALALGLLCYLLTLPFLANDLAGQKGAGS
jgi:hypothetical protein